MTFEQRITDYIDRVEETLAAAIPESDIPPVRLHKAMRYSVLGGGKRIRPLLVYAAGEALGIHPDLLDAPAAAIEMMHAFSLVHDDLPAMDNDNLRRGLPTTHRAFDEATAILAADALQPLAFQVLANAPALLAYPDLQTRLIALLAEACGSSGMTGGQAMDMAAEGRQLDQNSLEQMYRLKTGRLLRASVLCVAYCPPPPVKKTFQCLERYIDCLGLAYQIRDDILDIEGVTDQIGKTQGADLAHKKATFPVLFGMDAARKRAKELLEAALHALDGLADPADGLRWLAQLTVLRKA
jgi:geranylgeranyl diphosphate synthase type II